MFVQFYLPSSMPPNRLDLYLAGGWFRNNQMMFRTEMVCLDGNYYSTINIRSRLEGFSFSKNQRKTLSRNKERFTYKISPFTHSEEKAALYEQHTHRFKGFIYPTLKQFLNGYSDENVFKTCEIAVYDEDELIALSLFDPGEDSIASIMALYKPGYEKNSLGFYTLLLEVEYAISQGMKFFYPGFVLDKLNMFDYKLRLGNQEFFNWQSAWEPSENIEQQTFAADRLRNALDKLKQTLTSKELPHKEWIYPFFSLGYTDYEEADLLKSVAFLQCKADPYSNRFLICEFNLDENIYQLCIVDVMCGYEDVVGVGFAQDNVGPDVYMLDILEYREVLFKHKSPESICYYLEHYSYREYGELQ